MCIKNIQFMGGMIKMREIEKGEKGNKRIKEKGN
jgi:hypothetical protein